MLDKLSRLSGYDLKIKINDVKYLRLKEGEKRTVSFLRINFPQFKAIEKQSFQEILYDATIAAARLEGVRNGSGNNLIFIFSKGAPEHLVETAIICALEMKRIILQKYPDVEFSIYADIKENVMLQDTMDEITDESFLNDPTPVRKDEKPGRGTVLILEKNIKPGIKEFEVEELWQDGNLFYNVIKFVNHENNSADLLSGSSSVFAGRTSELQIINNLYNSVRANHPGKDFKPALAGINGEAGIGKSRFIKEFVRKIPETNILTGRASRAFNQPYGIFIPVIKTIAGITDVDTKEERWKKLNILCEILFKKIKSAKDSLRLKDAKPIIGYLLGIECKDDRLTSTYKELEDNINISLRHFIEIYSLYANSNTSASVFILDDCHWMDNTSKKSLQYILNTFNIERKREKTEPVKMLLILLYRPEFEPGWKIEKETDFTEINLQPLNETDCKDLIKGLNNIIDRDAIKYVLEKSGGNPLFIEEWIAHFFEQSKDNPNEAVNKKNIVPANISSIVRMRIDRLDKPARLLLQKASILGKVFSGRILFEIQKKFDRRHNFEQMLNLLAEKDFIYNIEKTSGTYSFKHDIIQEIIYDYVLPENKKIIHRIAAETLEEQFKRELKSHYFDLAEHYAKTDSEDKTTYYLEKAGDKAKTEYKNELAIDFYDRLLKGFEEKKSKKIYDILIKKGEILLYIGKWDEAEKVFERSFQLAVLLKDRILEAGALNFSGQVLNCKNNYPLALNDFKAALKIFEFELNAPGIMKSLGLIGVIFSKTGKFDKAKMAFEKQIKLAEEQNDKTMLSSSYHNLGLLYRRTGEYEKALEYYEKNLKLQKGAGDKKGIGTTLSSIGNIYYYKGELDKALQYFESSLKLAVELGLTLSNSFALGNIGSVFFTKGDFLQARNFYEKQKCIYEELNDESGIATSYGHIGNILLSEGKYQQAIGYYEKQLSINRKIGKEIMTGISLGNIGLAYNYMGETDRAVKYFKKQLQSDKKFSNNEGVMRAYMNIGNIYVKRKVIPKAIFNFQSAIIVGKKNNLNRYLLLSLIDYSEILYKAGDFKAALLALDEAITLSVRYGNSEDAERCANLKKEIEASP